MRVSRRVYLGVSQNSNEAQVDASDRDKTGGGSGKRGPGPYLIKSGSVYIFQIKVPKALGGGRKGRPVRLSLGACSQRRARALADLLAAEARGLFLQMRMRRMNEPDEKRSGQEIEVDQVFDGDSHVEVVAEMRGWLKAYLKIIEHPEPAFTPEDLQKTAGIRDLVSLQRELQKQQAGETYNELIVGNAELLKQTALAKLNSSTSPVVQAAMPVSPNVTPKEVFAASVEDVDEPLPLDENGRPIPAFKLDRRKVRRKKSSKSLFSEVAATYLTSREVARGKDDKDIRIARSRIDVFLELIGDHPVDTYDGSDLQAFVDLMQYWPADTNKRDPNVSAFDIIDDNRDLRLKPLALKSLKEGYVAVVRSAIRSAMTAKGYQDPFAGVKIHYPKTAAAPVSAEPLSARKISDIFRIGVESGTMDNVMLPLLGHLTGRRLGLLIHLKGTDFREKYENVWVAQTSGITLINGTWTRVPYKTDASTTFFVLHDFLSEIGFVQWAMDQGDKFIFPGLMKLADPSKSGSSYMQRLFEKAGVERNRKEVFHSLRGGNIEEMRDAKVEPRDRKIQVGHKLGADEHELYGFKSLSESSARELAKLPLNPDIDFSVFRGLDFNKIARNKRVAGPAAKKK